MKAKLVLSFSGGEYPELLRTEFWSPYHPHPIRGLRGSQRMVSELVHVDGLSADGNYILRQVER